MEDLVERKLITEWPETFAFRTALNRMPERRGANRGRSSFQIKELKEYTWGGLLKKAYERNKHLKCCETLFKSASSARNHIYRYHKIDEGAFSAPKATIGNFDSEEEQEEEGGDSRRTSQLEQAEAALKAEDEEIEHVSEEFTGVATRGKKLQAETKRRNRLLLEETEESLSSRSDRQPEEFTTLLKETEHDRIAQLLEKGKKLSKQQLESNNVIKKLRSKEKENDALVKKISKLLEDATSENKKLTEILQVKEETERKQADAITKLNAYVEKQEAQITKLKSELKDSAKKIRSMQAALDNTHKQLADLRKENVSKDGGVQKAALRAEMTAEKLRIAVSVPMSGREGLQLATQKEEVKVKNEIEELEFQFSDLQTGLTRSEQQASRREDYLPQEISDLQQKLQEAKAFKQEVTESVTYDEARSHELAELVEAQEKERVACVARSREAARYKTRYQIRKIKH